MHTTRQTRILEVANHSDGTATRLHVAYLLTGSPRRYRKNFVVGYGVKDGCAYSGANCHRNEAAARVAFALEVGRKGGAV